jgi:hypothetical protein
MLDCVILKKLEFLEEVTIDNKNKLKFKNNNGEEILIAIIPGPTSNPSMIASPEIYTEIY